MPTASPSPDETFLCAFEAELRARLWTTPRIRDARAEAEAHLDESGETAEMAFGDPTRYAAELDAAARRASVPTLALRLGVRIAFMAAVFLLLDLGVGLAFSLVSGTRRVDVRLASPALWLAPVLLPWMLGRLRGRRANFSFLVLAGVAFAIPWVGHDRQIDRPVAAGLLAASLVLLGAAWLGGRQVLGWRRLRDVRW